MNYKINVKNEEESERCQKALFAMGYCWGGTISQNLFPFKDIENGNITTESEEKLIWNDSETPPFEEISLPELEKLAADHLFANSHEFQYGEPINYEAVTIAESPDEAQRRYDAAIEFLGNQFPEKKKIQEALKIAAGLSQ